jgi:hypothetical protein
MMMNKRLAIGLSIWFLAGLARASFLVPGWVDDPRVSKDIFTFATNADPASPDPALTSNPHGDSLADILLGHGGEGWYDPTWSITLTRDGVTGVWDIGRYGRIDLAVPFAAEDISEIARLRVFIEVIGYVSTTALPTLYVAETMVPHNEPDVLNQSDPPLGAWYHRTWELDVVAEEGRHVNAYLLGDYNSSSIDRIAVYIIPEPRLALFGVFLTGAALWRKKRFIDLLRRR